MFSLDSIPAGAAGTALLGQMREAFILKSSTAKNVGPDRGSAGYQRLKFSVTAHRNLNLEHKHPSFCTDLFFFGIMKPFLEECLPVMKKQASWFGYLCLCKHFGVICENDQMLVGRAG